MRYLVFENGNYVDLNDGKFYKPDGKRFQSIGNGKNDPKKGLKFTPRELKLLKLMINNINSITSLETLCTVLESSEGKEKDNVYKRITNIKSRLRDLYVEADSIIKEDKDNPASKFGGYGLFLDDFVKLCNDPVFVQPVNILENEQIAKERKKIDAIADMAKSDSDLGKNEDALEKRKIVYNWRYQNLGEEHPETVRAMANLAVSYNKLKMFDEALMLRRKVLEIRERTCDPSSDLLRKAKKNLAVTLSSIGGKENALEAERLRKEIVDMIFEE